ncbi:ROK family transcriptional regulator [Sphaerisporangium album]|uniref:ROK family transcriptional regulator n=1 Tax=Sphaerisporangium album TaxID=509200 RepID=A0A367FGH0_9ACTN|nr:ROK family transcriptional regulator [Sphaerisporangium album]RCG29483.1 ROK family transcriptional regulator [Sphaerisporangium album]
MLKAGRSQEEIRQHNLGALLRHVHLGGAVSRAVLADRMGLNRSTIMALTAELTSAGLVREELPKETRKAGRPSLVVRPESDRVYVLAFDVRVDRLVAARVGLGGTILARREAVRRRAGADLDDVVGVLARFARLLHRDARPDSVCVGVGAAYCGMIRPGDGMVRFGPNMGWVDQAFGTELSDRLGLGLPVAVGNEAHLGALAEHQRGAGVGFQNLVYLHGDVGVGGGIIVGGKLLDGDRGYGCELGHMIVNPYDGRACGCGSRGCLEAEVGEQALIDMAGRTSELSGREGVRAVVDAAARGDEPARDALRRIGDWLGIGVANLINLFNPGVVIFGGMLREVYPSAAPEVHHRVTSNALVISREVHLRTSGLGDDSTLIGAAELAFSKVLSSPLEALAR